MDIALNKKMVRFVMECVFSVFFKYIYLFIFYLLSQLIRSLL